MLDKFMLQTMIPTCHFYEQYVIFIAICVLMNVDLTRDFPPGQEEFFKSDGVSAVLQCVGSPDSKLVIKALFLLTNCYSSRAEGNYCIQQMCLVMPTGKKCGQV